MKLEVYNDQKEKEILQFKINGEDDEIVLVVVDKKGNVLSNGTLLSIGKKGLYLYKNVAKGFGLPLDVSGKILTVEDNLKG